MKETLILAAHLLKEYGEQLSYNGCNDTTKEVRQMIDKIGKDEFQKMADDWNNGECEGAEWYDWIVAKAISHKLLSISKEL